MAASFSILLGGFLSDVLGSYAEVFTGLAQTIGAPLVGSMDIPMAAATVGHLLIASILAFAWGVAFHYKRHGTGQPEADGQASPPDPHLETADDSIPDQLTGIVTAGYDPGGIETADEEVCSYLQNALSDDIRSRLMTAHDRLVESERRDLADRVADVETDIERIERSLSSSIPIEDGLDADQRERLRATHVSLIEATAELRTCADTLVSESMDGHDGQSESVIDDTRERFQAVRDSYEERRKLLDQASNLP